MHLAWNDRRTRQFITNVGLITTNGPAGPDIMAAEWTHHISYSPSLIAISVRGHNTTAENIQSSREFGVNLVAADQNIVCRVAGRYSGKETDSNTKRERHWTKIYWNTGPKFIGILIGT